MKRRSSLASAENTLQREERYYKMCDEILYKLKSTIVITGTKAYLQSENEKKILLEIDNLKTKWFLIWLKLKELV